MYIDEKSKISKKLETYLANLELMGFIAYLDAYKEDDVDSSESDTEERTDREENYDTESEEEPEEPSEERTDREENYDTESEEEPEEPSEETCDSETSVEEDTVE